jgi:type I restriction enzyme S subunit
MEVRKGYKQTEVGVIPEDWDAVQLPDVIWFQEGPGLRNWQFQSNGIKVINVTNLQENGYLEVISKMVNWRSNPSWERANGSYRRAMGSCRNFAT